MQTLHPSYIHLLCWSLTRSVKRTWIGSTFSTNERASSAMVNGPQARVWSEFTLRWRVNHMWGWILVSYKVEASIVSYVHLTTH